MMSTKTKLLQKLELGERDIVIQDLIRLFQKSPDEKLESLLENIKLQYTQRIVDLGLRIAESIDNQRIPQSAIPNPKSVVYTTI